MDWYKKDMPAYKRATRYLTPTQNGIYDRLLTEYYSNEGPLPNDPKDLSNVCQCVTKRDKLAINLVLDRYFTLNGDGLLHNARADDELVEYKRMCDANRNAARRRYAVQSAYDPQTVRTAERKIDRKKEEKPVDNSQHQTLNTCPCGQPGTQKKHPTDKQWYCSEHA